MDKFKIHMVFMYHEIVCFFSYFFSHLKKEKEFLAHRLHKNQVVGHVWTKWGHRLLLPVLNQTSHQGVRAVTLL